jgi:putative hemolysin
VAGLSLGLSLLVVAFLLGLQAVFCAAEIAFFATGPVKARRYAHAGSRGGSALVRLLDNRFALLTTIITVITGVLSISEWLLTHQLHGLFPAYGHWIALFGLTAFVLVFIEVTPAVIASRNPERVSLILAPFVLVIHGLLYVVTVPLTLLSRGMLWLIGVRGKRPSVTEDEFMSMIQESEVEEDEKQMLRGAVTFADRTVNEVMVPRRDMVCVEEGEPVASAIEKMLTEKHSRLPVYRERRDQVVGIVLSKDLLPVVRLGRQAEQSAGECVRPAYHIPETMAVAELLSQFKSQRRVMAIAVDEFGATAGLVTMEDLLEEIVGEILDEYDEEEAPDVVDAGDGVYFLDGAAGIHELNRDHNLDLPEDGFETISGLVSSLLGRLPEGGEIVTCSNGRLAIEVLEVTERRVSRARLTRKPSDTRGPA